LSLKPLFRAGGRRRMPAMGAGTRGARHCRQINSAGNPAIARPAPPACVGDNSKRRSRSARSGNEMASFGAGGEAEGAPAGTQRERKGSRR
jgi:hypothetical protein